MSTLPKLESQFTLGSSQTIIVTENGGGNQNCVIAAGDYYLSSATSILTTLKTALDGLTGPGTYTVSLNDSTGKVTISVDGVNDFTIDWNSQTIESILGFSGNITPTTSSSTGANQSRYLFLPNVSRSDNQSPDGDDGYEESNLVTTVSTSGQTTSIVYNRLFLDTLSFNNLTGSKAWKVHEGTVNESLQKFYEDWIDGGGQFIRYYKDRTDDATYNEWRMLNGNYNPSAVVSNWTGSASLWNWSTDVRKKVS
jgi:hypothetical protein